MNNRVVLTGVLFSLFAAPAFAQQDNAKKEIEELRRVVDAASTRLNILEKQQGMPAKDTAKSDGMSWTDMIKIWGDFRFRNEYIDQENVAAEFRQRMRVRLGLDAKVNDEIDFVFRLTTSEGGNPVSQYQTFSGGESKKPFDIDHAYVDLHPDCMKDLHLFGGKMKNPFYTATYNQLIWDGDLSPEGMAASWAGDLGGLDTFWNAGAFWVTEVPAGPDVFLWGAQGGVNFKMDSDVKLKTGAGYYNYANTKGSLPPFSATGRGNTTSGGVYTKDYDLFEVFAELGFDMNGLPVTAFGNYVKNVATAHADHGWILGVNVGKLKDPGSWAIHYDYRLLEADAVLGEFTDSDSWGGGTNARGHVANINYQIAKHWTATVAYFHTERTLGNTTGYDRAQLDFGFSF